MESRSSKVQTKLRKSAIGADKILDGSADIQKLCCEDETGDWSVIDESGHGFGKMCPHAALLVHLDNRTHL